MNGLNYVFLLGNLTRDPDLKYLPNGTPVANFGLAINNSWIDKQGTKKDDVCFVEITVWNRQAETANEFLRKGSLVFIEGRLKFDTWELEGQKRSKLSVVAQRIQFLGSPPKKEEEMGL